LFIYNFTLYSYSRDKNCLTLSIFIFVLLFLVLLWWWWWLLLLLLLLLCLLLLILLFDVLVLNTSNVVKFGFVTLDITRKNYLYSILNVEIHLDVMGLGDTIKEINKASEQLICSSNNNIVKKKNKRISQILWIYFMPLCG